MSTAERRCWIGTFIDGINGRKPGSCIVVRPSKNYICNGWRGIGLVQGRARQGKALRWVVACD